MSAWHVIVEMRQTFVLSVEADSALEAQTIALGEMTHRTPEKLEITTEVERGVA